MNFFFLIFFNSYVVYISILATLLLELSLNLKKCIRIFERSEKILMHFFEFKVDSNNRVASIEIYTTHLHQVVMLVWKTDCSNIANMLLNK